MNKIEITPELLADLKAKAEKATPGPWKQHEHYPHVIVDGVLDPICEVHRSPYAYTDSRTDAAYVAAASPDVVLALIEKIEAIERPDMTDELELDGDNIFDRLIALIAISTPEVALTMKDGSVKRALLDADKIVAEIQKAKSLVERAERLEKEADWLAGNLEKACHLVGPVCFTTARTCPIRCNVDNENTCKNATTFAWREAARKAVEPNPDLFDRLAEHPDTKLAPEEEWPAIG